ncbi:MAG: hypothetical protein C0402_05895 [Thermodesulfovibrio sp.]|nr:hypothetical protein [Thermodesulfovibrio sp.]
MELDAPLKTDNLKVADYIMAFDLLSDIAATATETQVVDKIFLLFTVLCSPKSLAYLPVIDGQVTEAFLSNGSEDRTAAGIRLAQYHGEFTVLDDGFVICIESGKMSLGILEMTGINFTQYRDHYLNLALHLRGVLALGISNARNYEALEAQRKMLRAERDRLQDALSQIRILSGIIPICASCKKIRDDKGYWNQLESYISEHSDALFSHGFCPHCEANMMADIEKMKKKA